LIAVKRIDRARRVARLRALRGLYQSYCMEKLPAVRARRLLREWLSPEQNLQLNQLGHFEVTGGTTGKCYRIMQGACANVSELDDNGEPVRGLCFVPAGRLEACDVMLAQKIALESCEADARAVANWFPPKVPFITRSLVQNR